MQRISRLLAISKERTPAAIGELVTSLGDGDEQVRWPASMALNSIGGPVVVATLESYLAQGSSVVAREEAVRLERLMQSAASSRIVCLAQIATLTLREMK